MYVCVCAHVCVCTCVCVRVGRKSEMGWVNAIEFKQITADFVFVAKRGKTIKRIQLLFNVTVS